jgi:hypothetical protein
MLPGGGVCVLTMAELLKIQEYLCKLCITLYIKIFNMSGNKQLKQ